MFNEAKNENLIGEVFKAAAVYRTVGVASEK